MSSPSHLFGETGAPRMLRPEARPISYGDLDERQQDCFNHVVALLRAAVSDDRPTIGVDSRGGGPTWITSAPRRRSWSVVSVAPAKPHCCFR
jgi:hypothetical protein